MFTGGQINCSINSLNEGTRGRACRGNTVFLISNEHVCSCMNCTSPMLCCTFKPTCNGLLIEALCLPMLKTMIERQSFQHKGCGFFSVIFKLKEKTCLS